MSNKQQRPDTVENDAACVAAALCWIAYRKAVPGEILLQAMREAEKELGIPLSLPPFSYGDEVD